MLECKRNPVSEHKLSDNARTPTTSNWMFYVVIPMTTTTAKSLLANLNEIIAAL